MTGAYAAVMTAASDPWLLLIVSLPTSSATARMRIWRAVKTLGCVALRDGVYLLPAHAEQATQLRDLADGALQEDGHAWVLRVQAEDPAEDAAYRAMFDRTADYIDWLAQLSDARKTLSDLAAAERSRLQRRHARAYEAIRKIDFFRMKRPCEPMPNGATSPPRSRLSSPRVSHMLPRAASRAAIPLSIGAACGRRAAICGSIVSPAPG